jgi:hypothetical protein
MFMQTFLSWSISVADVGGNDEPVPIPPSAVSYDMGTLSLGRNFLAQGRSYTFVLSVRLSSSMASSSAAVTMRVNAPPANGTVQAYPSSGVAMDTLFDLSTAAWQDAENVGSWEIACVSWRARLFLCGM